jgi:hypothetical protein
MSDERPFLSWISTTAAVFWTLNPAIFWHSINHPPFCGKCFPLKRCCALSYNLVFGLSEKYLKWWIFNLSLFT